MEHAGGGERENVEVRTQKKRGGGPLTDSRRRRRRRHRLPVGLPLEARINDVAVKTDVAKRSGPNPVFDNTVTLPIIDDRRWLEVSAFAAYPWFLRGNSRLGTCVLDLAELVFTEEECSGWFTLEHPKKLGVCVGEVKLELTFVSVSKPRSGPSSEHARASPAAAAAARETVALPIYNQFVRMRTAFASAGEPKRACSGKRSAGEAKRAYSGKRPAGEPKRAFSGKRPAGEAKRAYSG
ncbi:MAG: hypothetical protein BJ554DRAFT_3619, partial [Olpidium bornovanus]